MSMLTPSRLLRAESVVLLAVTLGLYQRHGDSWLLFAILFLAPDLSAFGYFAGNRIGALAYNLAHAFIAPGILIFIGFAGPSLATSLALIWAAHITMDRAIGYGLKYEDGVTFNHLHRV